MILFLKPEMNPTVSDLALSIPRRAAPELKADPAAGAARPKFLFFLLLNLGTSKKYRVKPEEF